ncbi:MAG: TonB-dependent receptor [Steroidobacter sp.]
MVVKQVIAGLVAALVLCVALPLGAQTKISAAQVYVFDIPELPIIDALKEFTTQTGLLVSFWPDAQTDQAMMVGPLRGKHTAEAALTRLLATSGLAFQRTNDRSLVVMAPSLLSTPRNGGTPSERDRTKQAEAKPNLRDQSSSPVAEHLVAAGTPGSAAKDPEYSRDPMDEIIVTGSRIERSGEGPAPVQVFTRETFERLGASTVQDVLRYTPQQPFTRAQHFYQSGSEYAQMRGIGVDTTLILINGRRVVPTSNSLVLNAFDLNTIPLAAVERIEVLSDSASAIYGADAMGGVINVVTKKEIPQPVIDAHYGGAEGGGESLRSSLSAGFTTDRLRSSLILDYFEQDFLFGSERDRWSNQDYTRYGGTDYRSMAGAPGTVRSVTGQNLPGLSSSFAMVPEGSTGIGLTPADFVATAGMRNRTSTLSTSSVVPSAHQRSAAAFAEYDLTSDLTAFAHVLYTNRDTISQDEAYTVQNAPVPVTNPFNPFGQPVLVDVLLTGMPARQFVHGLELTRGVAGLRGWLGSNWEWEVAATASSETDDAYAVNQVSAARVAAALASTDRASALNPFVDGPAGSPELLASLVTPNVQHHFSRGRQLSGFMRGSLWHLPSGTISAVLGGEWRDESVIYGDLTQSVDDGRDVKAAFAELSVPLLSSAPYGKGDVLAMSVAARLDDYSDFGSTLNPQFGLTWRPVADLLLRGSFGTSFRPPSLYELRSPRMTAANVPLNDPARNNVLTNVTLVAGGNADLQPIEADSMTAGFVLTPSEIPGLRLLGNYWKIHTNHRVTVLHFSTLLRNEDAFNDRVVRAEPTPADAAAGRPGQLLQLDVSRMNFGRLTTSGVDVEASYDMATSFGTITPRVSATWVDEFVAIDVPGAAPVDRVGIAHSSGSIPRWRVVGSLAWNRGGVGLSTTIDWRPVYMDANTNGLTGRRLPARTLVDLQGTLALDQLFAPNRLWEDFKLQLGVKNVFDEQPPFADIGFAVGFDTSQGDLAGRFGYMKLSKGF